MIRSILVVFITLFNISFAQNYFNQLIELRSGAIEKSPELEMYDMKIKSSEFDAPMQSNLPDPVMTIGLANLPVGSFSFTQEPMTGKVVGLSQKFPFPGKLSAAEEYLNAESEIILQDKLESENKIKLEVSSAYFDLIYADAVIETIEKNIDLVKSISDVAKTKYEVGKTGQEDIIALDLKITELEDRIEEMKSIQRSSRAVLNSWLFTDTVFSLNTDILDTLFYNEVTEKMIIDKTVNNRPLLKKSKLNAEKSRLKEETADYEYYPDFTVSLQYSQRDELESGMALDDFFSVMVGFNIPINYGGKKSAGVEKAITMQNLYKRQYETYRQLITKSLSTAFERIEVLKKREELYSDVMMRQTVQAFNSVLSGYQSGTSDFNAVLNSIEKLITIEIKQYKVRVNYYKLIAEIEYLTATEIFNKEL